MYVVGVSVLLGWHLVLCDIFVGRYTSVRA